jgi:hypothetical protein
MGRMSDETVCRPDVIPAVCENGHVTYPTVYVLLGGEMTIGEGGKYRRPCPVCGGVRGFAPGRYETDAQGKVFRAGDAGDETAAVTVSGSGTAKIRGLEIGTPEAPRS